MPEDAYGHWDSGPHSISPPVTTAASNTQLGALTEVLHKMGIVSEVDKLTTVSALLGRDMSTLRGLRRHEAQDLLTSLGIVG